MSTPHNSAQKGDIAKTVLMPGDPLRAKFIAETYLSDVKQFNAVRNMFGYTGTYKGKEVSVMGSGMGMPSIGIYSYELFNMYDVDTIIRVGSAGAYTDQVKLFDTILVTGAFSNSTYAKYAFGYVENMLQPSTQTNKALQSAADALNIPLTAATIHSSDTFYSTQVDYKQLFMEHGCVCVEMESFALFANARHLNKNAACLLTISDSVVTKQATSALERQNSFTQMMEVALNSLFY